MFNDNLFKKIEDKTNIGKGTLLSLASKLQGSNMKDEGVLRDLISEISALTGKEVSAEKTNKIVNAVLNDKVPKDVNDLI
ncbi:MAG: stage VI sporulation protein F [Bacilli bacterium]